MKEKLKNTQISDIQKDVLIGTILGDCCIRIQYNYPYGILEHSEKQKDYLEYKYNILKNLSSNISCRTRNPTDKSLIRTTCSSCQFRIRTNSNLLYFYNLFYEKNKKIIKDELLSLINERVLAIWYMDDGWLNFSKNKNTCGIATLCFSKKDNEKLCAYLTNRYNVEFSVTRRKESYYLTIRKQNDVEKFINIVSEYIPNCMKYKKDLTKRDPLLSNKRKIICNETGEIYDSIAKASRILTIKKSILYSRLKNEKLKYKKPEKTFNYYEK